MANYKFTNLNSGANIANPKVIITNVSYNNGIANVDIQLSVANTPQGQAPNFGVTLEGFAYAGEQPINSEVEAWVVIELEKYKV